MHIPYMKESTSVQRCRAVTFHMVNICAFTARGPPFRRRFSVGTQGPADKSLWSAHAWFSSEKRLVTRRKAVTLQRCMQFL